LALDRILSSFHKSRRLTGMWILERIKQSLSAYPVTYGGLCDRMAASRRRAGSGRVTQCLLQRFTLSHKLEKFSLAGSA
jgi:hypothetical protein